MNSASESPDFMALYKLVFNLTNRKNVFMLSDAFSGLEMANKCVCGRGSAQDPAEGAYSAPRPYS